MTEISQSAVTQEDLDCRNAIYKELTGAELPDDLARQPDWMDKYISAARIAAEQRGALAERERAAKVVKAHADDRGGRDKNFDWHDGYMDACLNASQAILTGANP